MRIFVDLFLQIQFIANSSFLVFFYTKMGTLSNIKPGIFYEKYIYNANKKTKISKMAMSTVGKFLI